jgi:hypothetical protein
MNPLSDALVRGGLLLDVFGVLGLGLIGLTAVRLSRRDGSWGGPWMSVGALSLLSARLFVLAKPALTELGVTFTGTAARLAIVLPPLFLILGLAGIVWGVWAHDRWLRECR